MQVVKAPDTRLRFKTKPVKKITPELLKTIQQMVKLTKTYTDPEGVGLASTQIGESEQYFILKEKSGSFKTVFNPQILKYSPKTKIYFEGCLSIPNYYGEVSRSTSVTVSYQDPQGKKVQEILKGLEAWIFQHEYDHLQGKLFIDYVMANKGKLYHVVGRDRAGGEIFEEVGY